MHLFKHTFPKNSVVTVTNTNSEVIVSVTTPRPDPTWLKGIERKLRLMNGEVNVSGNLKFSDSELDSKMFDLISKKPGHSKSFYTQLKKEQGGFGASQERKEKAVMRLELEGKITRRMLEYSVGRKNHELRPVY